jgi:hypothetical protein
MGIIAYITFIADAAFPCRKKTTVLSVAVRRGPTAISPVLEVGTKMKQDAESEI